MPIYLNFYFWLLAITLLCFALERLAPWRKKQPALRHDVLQDAFWLFFNTNFVGWMVAMGALKLLAGLNTAFSGLSLPALDSLKLLADWPFAAQLLVAYLLKDFLAWNVHRLLHTVPALWKFHQLHHSITEPDWLTTFRTHWGESILYKAVIFLPIVSLGVDDSVIFTTIVSNNLIQILAHSNVNLDWGPLRYVFVSPRYHAWHHDLKMHGKNGQNFAVELTLWDWLFRTAYYPAEKEQPDRYGFHGMKTFPKTILGRILYPFYNVEKSAQKKPPVDTDGSSTRG